MREIILAFGRSVIDYFFHGLIQASQHDELLVRQGGLERKLHILDGPFEENIKHHTSVDMHAFVDSFDVDRDTGGAATNIVYALDEMGVRSHPVWYIDPQQYHEFVAERMNLRGASVFFEGRGEINGNLMHRVDSGKVTLRGQVESEEPVLSDFAKSQLWRAALVFNVSPKWPGYASQIVTQANIYDIPLFSSVTPTFPWELSEEILLGKTPISMSFDEVAKMKGLNGESKYLSTQDHVEIAVDHLQHCAALSPYHPVFVTLGEMGTMYAHQGDLYHTSLPKTLRREVKTMRVAPPDGTNRAGDFNDAAVAVALYLQDLHVHDAVIRGQQVATRRVGYAPYIMPEAFETVRITNPKLFKPYST